MEINGIQVADWAAAEYRKKSREERSVDFFAYVRCLVALLSVATVLVFLVNQQPEIHRIVSAKLHLIGKRFTTSDKLRQQALKHEKEVNKVIQ